MSLSSRKPAEQVQNITQKIDGLDGGEIKAGSSTIPASVPFSIFDDNRIEKLRPIPKLSKQELALMHLQSDSLLAKQSEPLLIYQSMFLKLSDHRSMSQTCRRMYPFFQPPLITSRLQQLLDAVSHANVRKIIEIALTDPTCKLFRMTGTTTNSAGQMLEGKALQIALSAGDHSIERKREDIAHNKCNLLPVMSEIPTEATLPPGGLRAYVFVKDERAASLELYFVERMQKEAKATITKINFLPGITALSLSAKLSPSADYDDEPFVIKLTPLQLSIITWHTGHTYEEGAVETIKRLMILPLGKAEIDKQHAQQFPAGWEIQEAKRVEGDLKALHKMIAVLKKISVDECTSTSQIDTHIQVTITSNSTEPAHKELRAIIKAIHKADSDAKAEDKNSFANRFSALKDYLHQNKLVDPTLFSFELLEAVFQFRNHLEPKGIIRTGKHSNHHLIKEAIRLYLRHFAEFGNFWEGAPKNEFNFQRVYNYCLRVAADCDAFAIYNGPSRLLDARQRLTRETSSFTAGYSQYMGYCYRIHSFASEWMLPDYVNSFPDFSNRKHDEIPARAAKRCLIM